MKSDYNKLKGIKSWAEEDRPREKLVNKGPENLTNAELLAILLGSGTNSKTAVDLAREILSSYDNSLQRLAKSSIADLTTFKGVGKAKAINIITGLELGKRREQLPDVELKVISSSKDVYDLLQVNLKDKEAEEFWIVFLNQANRILSKKKISSGGLNATVVDPRLIFKMALEQLATSLILCHNHPSGNLKPSKQDLSLTQKLFSAGKVMDIRVLDHLIISSQGYLSFADEGIMPKD